MKILHTGDWHLGKTLEGYSRINEQKLFLEELCDICEKNSIDILVVAGDVFDNFNPSAEAEKIFYIYLKRLSNKGKRAIVIISGNHDSPNRLTCSTPLAQEFCIIIEGTPKTLINSGAFGDFVINKSFEGGFEIEKKGEKAVFITMPYLTEKNINEIISNSIDEEEFKKSYSEKIRELFAEKSIQFKDSTINIVVGHFYISGGVSTDSERSIQLGGSYAVNSDIFPEKTQYVAMGHLHRPQHIKTNIKHSYYAGSPIQYSKSETNYTKSVFIVELHPSQEASVEKIYLNNYKPIKIWKADSIEQAIKMCKERKDENCFVFFEIKTDRTISQSEIKTIKTLKKDIVEIQPIIYTNEQEQYYCSDKEKTIPQQFEEFYKIINGVSPSSDMIDLFLEIVSNIDMEQ